MRVRPFALSFVLPLALASVPPPLALAQAAAAPPAALAVPDALKDPRAQAGYILGLEVGAQIRSDGVSVDPGAVARGVSDGLANAKPLLSPEQIGAVTNRIQGEILARRQEKAARAGETNKTEGAAFLKANGAKPGVVTLPSGLQYQVLTAGTGPKPKPSDTVVCNYRGTLIDGTEFDSSYGRGEPLTIPVGGVIKGWTEALQLMPVGSKWRLSIPADLAYGDKGAGDKVGPGAVLIFEVELLSIKAG